MTDELTELTDLPTDVYQGAVEANPPVTFITISVITSFVTYAGTTQLIPFLQY